VCAVVLNYLIPPQAVVAVVRSGIELPHTALSFRSQSTTITFISLSVMATIKVMASDLISGMKLMSKPKDMTSVVLLIAAVICVIVPLDISQLVFAIAGALGFSAIQMMQSKARSASNTSSKKVSKPKSVDMRPQDVAPQTRNQNSQRVPSQASRNKIPVPQNCPRLPSQPDVRKPSTIPILAPTFQSDGWSAQATELLSQIAPTAHDEEIVGRLAKRVEEALKAILPEVEVVGFASGSLGRNKAFGVAVPEVDIVANVNPVALMRRLGSKNGNHAIANDEHKLRKMAIRACTDRLVAVGGFKFRRSAFRGDEPKVTLLAPATFGLTTDAIPIDFSVNAAVPLYNAALLTECGQLDARAKALILLVKRWAKDRGVCHAAKGHLSPYTWGLLTIFFLQVTDQEGPFLPQLSSFKMASGLMKHQVAGDEATWSPSASTVSAGDLFKQFMRFYSNQFDWRAEAVSVRVGKREKPGLKLPLHVILHDDNKTTEVGPSIEDPFNEAKNLGNAMNQSSLSRLREELQRADSLCTTGSLAELLEPWAPPVAQEE